MDEMRTLKDFRADAPTPDRARLAPGHQRVLDEAGRPKRRLRGGWWLAAIGAAAAITVVATLATLLPAPHEPAASDVKPRADQWIYRKTAWRTVNCSYVASGSGSMEWLDLNLESDRRPCDLHGEQSRDEEGWVRYDGRMPMPRGAGAGATPEGVEEWVDAGGDTLSPQQADALVEDLPDDTDAALRMIRKRSIPSRVTSAWRLTQAQRDFEEVAEVLAMATRVPSDKKKLLYRIAGELDGARTVEAGPEPDRGHKRLVALAVDGNYRDYSYERNTFQVLFDPETFAFRGFRLVAGMGYYVDGKASGGPYVAKGTVLATAVRVTTKVVDKSGART
ncbi:hypothetical protein OH805_13580 [Streptomyces sp. NBC_00879]|uniref:hypothetical protein n=1 Tax=Streptomyces sp. NBC_00879 TaxID=2975855 RepID=UPI0038700F58|nr:hypothetical protein OH805_13580 [Streptomyces sp. NBC_00879]